MVFIRRGMKIKNEKTYRGEKKVFNSSTLMQNPSFVTDEDDLKRRSAATFTACVCVVH